jgi:hypothetical protein
MLDSLSLHPYPFLQNLNSEKISHWREIVTIDTTNESTLSGKLAVMYLCVKGIYFAYDFFIWILKLFRQCGLFFFHFIT